MRNFSPACQVFTDSQPRSPYDAHYCKLVRHDQSKFVLSNNTPSVNRVCFTYLCKLLMSFIDVHTKLFIWICPNARCQHKEAQKHHYEDGDKNVTNCTLWQCKKQLCTRCTSVFHFCTFRSRSRPVLVIKSPGLQLCVRREHLTEQYEFFSCYFQAAHTCFNPSV